MATPTNLPPAEVAFTPLAASWLNDLRGAFRILQVVSATTTTQDSTASGTYVNTSLAATITPQAVSSQILVITNQAGYAFPAGTEVNVRLVRNLPTSPTVLQTQIAANYSASSPTVAPVIFAFLDSPASTASLTYRTQFARGVGSGTGFLQINNNPATMFLLEVSA